MLLFSATFHKRVEVHKGMGAEKVRARGSIVYSAQKKLRPWFAMFVKIPYELLLAQEEVVVEVFSFLDHMQLAASANVHQIAEVLPSDNEKWSTFAILFTKRN